MEEAWLGRCYIASEGRAELGETLEMKMLRMGKGGRRWEVVIVGQKIK
jgi:hypothetical protein